MTDPRRVGVWEAFADQFLDTEVRYDIPRAALCCVEAGITAAEAWDIWRFEATPAVHFNIWSVVGEWALWNTEWLRERIERIRADPLPPRPLAHALYRLRVHFLNSVGVAIVRCVKLLEACPPESRRQAAFQLVALARHYFDFCPQPIPEGERAELRLLYQRDFLPLFRQLSPPSSADARVRAALV